MTCFVSPSSQPAAGVSAVPGRPADPDQAAGAAGSGAKGPGEHGAPAGPGGRGAAQQEGPGGDVLQTPLRRRVQEGAAPLQTFPLHHHRRKPIELY